MVLIVWNQSRGPGNKEQGGEELRGRVRPAFF